MKNIFLTIFAITALFAPLFLNGQVKIINTIAGNNIVGYSGDGGPATAAEFTNPSGVAVDLWGNIYIADLTNNAVRKINVAGIVTTIMEGGLLDSPFGIAVDAAGNVYVSSSGKKLVLEWSGGTVAIVAGGGGSYADGVAATSAALSSPQGVAIDAAGNLYFADLGTNLVRKVVAATGKIYTVAGNRALGHGYSGDGGPATLAQLYAPYGVAVDGHGNVYIADGLNSAIREVVVSTGNIITIVGKEVGGFGTAGFAGDGGPASAALVKIPYAVAISDSGNLYIADAFNYRIREINTLGIINTIAGNGVAAYGGDGGPADSAELYFSTGIAFDANWNILLADAGNEVVRKITNPNGIFFTGGGTQNITVCEKATTPVNTLLSITDTTAGETTTWSVVSAPGHGTLLASYTAISTGGVILPTGLTYTSYAAYVGTDSFIVKATNGSVTAYTTIMVAINRAPVVVMSAAYPSICNGSVDKIIVGGDGTPGGGDTVMIQNFNISLGAWVVDTSGCTGHVKGAAWHDEPNNFLSDFGYFHNPDSTSFALAQAYGSGGFAVTKSRLISPSFSLTGYPDATLYFDQSYKNNKDTCAEVDISTDGGTTWTTLKNYSLTYPTDLVAGIHPFLPETLSLRPYAGMPNLKLRFYLNSPNGFYWAIDNISVVGYPTGINATTWSPVTNLFTNTGLTSAYITGDYRDTVYMHPTTVTMPTNFTYYATQSIGGCSLTDSVTITVNPEPVITGGNMVCAGGYDTLSDATLYGAWTASNGDVYIGFTSGIINGLTAGVDTITYTVSSGSCAGKSTYTVTVSAGAPVAGAISGASTVCAGASVALTDAVTGGIWSCAATGIATVSGAGIVAGVASGTATISYRVTNGCGTAATAATITVGPLPVAGTITGASTVCAGAAIGLTDAVTGGAWSSSNTGVATVSGLGSVTGIAGGTAIISYLVTNSCGSVAATKTVTVDPLPVAGTITGTATVCVGATTSLTDAAVGGVWSSGSTSIATVSGTGMVTGISAGTAVISYLVTNGCGSVSAMMTVTVNPLPVAGTITGTATVCAGTTTSLTDAAVGGVWSSGSTSIATVSGTGMVTGISAGTAVISYLVTNGCGSVSAMMMVTVNPLPVAGTITGTATVCAGATTSLTDAAVGGVWSSASTSIATVSGTGMVTGISAGTAVISYLVTNGCGSVSAMMMVTVNPLPVAGTITGTATVCAGATTSLTDAAIGGVWSSASTSIATVSGTGMVTGVSAGTAVISYLVTNGCGSVSTIATVTVNPLPVAGTITGTATVCAGATTSLTDAAVGGVWSSGSTSIAAVSGTGMVTGISAGTAVISYLVTNGCGSVAAIATVTVNPLPGAGIITGSGEVCVGATLLLSDAAGSGVWSSSNALATISGSGIVTGVMAGTDTLAYTVTNSCGIATVTQTMLIDPLPLAGNMTGRDTVCAGQTISLSDAIGGGVWSSGNTALAAIDASGVVTGISAGNVAVTYSVTNSCGMADTALQVYVLSGALCSSGISTVTSNTEVKVYPDPNSGTFTVEVMSGEDKEVHAVITNMVGERVQSFTTHTNTQAQVRLDVAAGVYFLSIDGLDMQYVVKVAVIR